MSILRDLLNTGINANDAQILEQYFAAEPDFLAGLEQISRSLATDRPELLPPAGEPWSSIHASMLANGQPIADAFNQALTGWDAPVQMAITGAVSQRMQEIQDWLNKTANQGKRRKPEDLSDILKNLGYSFRFNQCTNNVEINGEKITDTIMYEIRKNLRSHDVWEVNIAEETYMAEAWGNRYHPIRDYYTGLKYQGGDPIGDLATHFVDEHGVFSIWLRRWLIGAIARVFQGAQNRMLIMEGAQGKGKSHFAEWVASPNPDYFYEGAIFPDNKDYRLKLLWTWIWEVNEFGSTARRADREMLKAFLTTKKVNERRAWGKFETNGIAMTSFIGTVNNESGILSDPTGNRRFMVAHIQEIDWNYTSIDIDQVWAQAFDLYLNGEPWDLTPDEKKLADEINSQYETIDIVEETIKKWFVIQPGDPFLWMSSTEILEVLKDPLRGNLKAGTEIDTRRIAAALTKLGLDKPRSKKISGSVIRGYHGIRLAP
jgi:predicted P-loop ATPase